MLSLRVKDLSGHNGQNICEVKVRSDIRERMTNQKEC